MHPRDIEHQNHLFDTEEDPAWRVSMNKDEERYERDEKKMMVTLLSRNVLTRYDTLATVSTRLL